MFLTASQSAGLEPKRIVSLVPSQTELLHYLQLEAQTVGITKFCVHPEKWFKEKIRVGGTKTVDIKKVRALKPDLIIANKEENVQEQVAMLATEFPVWVTNVNNLTEAKQMILDAGALTHSSHLAKKLVENIEDEFLSLSESFASSIQLSPISLISTCYLIWKDPYMTVGSDTFIHDMMYKAGFINVFDNCSRYPSVSLEEMEASGCRLLLLSSEPYPFKEKHIEELRTRFPKMKIALVDGEMFSWYGSRLLLVPNYFKKLRTQITR